MSRAIGITDFLNRKFDTYPFDGKWLDSFGLPEKNFKMLVFGHPGNGKTEFCIQLAKYLSQWTKVDFNSYEQGIAKTLQDALIRNSMEEVTGRVMFLDQMPLHELNQRLERPGSARVVIIDSRDFMNLTTEQFKKLIKKFHRKSFIVVCWESAGKPKSQYAKDMEYIVDIKVRVSNFKAHPRCRFGGNQSFTIWDRKPVRGEQLEIGGSR